MTDDLLYVGVLFSQNGPMAVTEKAHLKGILTAISEINTCKKKSHPTIIPIIEDPISDPNIYRQLAHKLITKDRVRVIFGCCSSASRKAVLGVIEHHGGLLFYPSFYEGYEYCPNILYGGASPNQMIIPLINYLFKHYGENFLLIGSDYIYPREINRIAREFLQESTGKIAGEIYITSGSSTDQFYQAMSAVSEDHIDSIISTVVGEDTAKLYHAYQKSSFDPKYTPIASLTTSENELATMVQAARANHLTAASYFYTIKNKASLRFHKYYANLYNELDYPGIYAETTYTQMHLYSQAVSKAQTDNVDSILSCLLGMRYDAPQGTIMIDPDNNHTFVTPKIGLSRRDGGFDIVWQANDWIKPDPYLISYDRMITSNTV
ncbi:MAG: transporter substrate-binding domain-containing protein [Pseudomonadota bacterium]